MSGLRRLKRIKLELTRRLRVKQNSTRRPADCTLKLKLLSERNVVHLLYVCSRSGGMATGANQLAMCPPATASRKPRQQLVRCIERNKADITAMSDNSQGNQMLLCDPETHAVCAMRVRDNKRVLSSSTKAADTT